ncbi:pickpocket protein 28-like isoform X2 [Anoplophora glabripennis]|uniref:pickpocket protein 28-like isoform X2 n=1 Tax=Anoplophora glabripennis TaxID=217634 RepID=UPI00087585BE|nr:pickpocket protein 28-like isoform X2 [Anoplophora glabripennis]
MELKSDKTPRYPNSTRKKAVLYFKEYCDYTGIHGFRYIAEDRTLCERIWWIISLVLSGIFCGLMIYQILQKYLNYPVIVTFSMQEVHMNEIPFPAVTICPRTKISQKYFNITDATIKKINNQSFSGETERMYNLASTICDFYCTEDSNNGTSYDDFYKFLRSGETNIFLYCSYTGLGLDCDSEFTRILTEEGNCYSFNIMDKNDIFRDNLYNSTYYNEAPSRADWNIEEGYINPKNVDAYPLRAFRSGAKNGLFVVLKTKREDIEYDCSSDENGYRVAVHLPSKIPDISDSYITVPFNQRVSGQIVPHLIRTSSDVKMFDPIQRDCYFQSERLLKFFKIYSQENCLIECKTEFMLNECGCVGFYMPPNFTMLTMNLQLFAYKGKEPVVNCDCLPSCTDLTYSLEISQSNFVYRPHDTAFQLDEDYEYSILNLYFKRNHIETKERNELYGFSDFISNFGGLLGLFTGFSMLSFIEIIYFLSLRIWGNIKMYKNWSGKNK